MAAKNERNLIGNGLLLGREHYIVKTIWLISFKLMYNV